LGLRTGRLAGLRAFTPIRLGVLAFVLAFVGWWGQGQLSIVTVLGAFRTAMSGGSFAYLLYDPFSLLIWGVTILGFFLWGRGLFCGWLCPFGALQEFAHHLGRLLRLPKVEPSALWDARLKTVKYLLLAGMVVTVLVAPDTTDTVAEIEPFKTAITVFFMRSLPFAAYAIGWVVLGMFTFKGFCRYVCPLGAVMALGGLVRGRDWIARRAECGSPCQLCKVRCNYKAIRPNGSIVYSECFQCLDCVTIHDDPKICVPVVLAARGRKLEVAK
jgi:NosR/NirI family nitrous oxide reductase transcriptional regulator